MLGLGYRVRPHLKVKFKMGRTLEIDLEALEECLYNMHEDLGLSLSTTHTRKHTRAWRDTDPQWPLPNCSDTHPCGGSTPAPCPGPAPGPTLRGNLIAPFGLGNIFYGKEAISSSTVYKVNHR